MYIVQSTCISFSLFKISSLFENFEQQKNQKENRPENLLHMGWVKFIRKF